MTDGGVTASLAVQRRREGRREEWTEQTKLAALLAEYLDLACTYWTALENKPLSAMSGVFQRRRGVKAGIPDVVVIFRQPSGNVLILFVELKSWRGQQGAKTGPCRDAAGRGRVVDGTKRKRRDDGVGPFGRAVSQAVAAGAANC